MGYDREPSETGNWNVAEKYSDSKIMRLLNLIDSYELIATFGTSNMIDQYVMNQRDQDFAKVMAIKWYHKTLGMLIDNTIFAVKPKDGDKLSEFRKDLKKIKPTLSKLYDSGVDVRSKRPTIKIAEDKFDQILEMLIKIKTEMNTPLNQADLIFTHKEIIDPVKMKEMAKQKFINEG